MGCLVVLGSREWVGRGIGCERQADAVSQIGWNGHAQPGSDGAAQHAFEPEGRDARRTGVEVGLNGRVMVVVEFAVEERVQIVNRIAAVPPDTGERAGSKGGFRCRTEPWLGPECRR